ncbi:MAG: ribosome biogenesis GTPase Der [Elusimicrobia bacterium]|nr:ribosome biogenesis GTPase Der [Elusimicrobiota bacterium]
MLENVVIIGRPNVGKSTIFNRIIGRRKAIVHHAPGTTRDRNENHVEWKDKEFILTDTGGWALHDEVFSESVKKQMEIALQKADLVLFVVDGKDGLHPLDQEINHILRRMNKKFLLVVNKIDNKKDELKAFDFFKLGLDDFTSISAQHGLNINTLLEKITKDLKAAQLPDVKTHQINIILVGKPNVGKSSLLNVLSKEERSIVHDKPGTTREAFETIIEKENSSYVIIDTPGLHRKRKFKDDLEYLSALSTHHAIEKADVAILITDAVQGIGETESKIAQLIVEKGKACLIAVNKWDLIEDKENTLKILKQQVEQNMKFLSWADILLISCKTGQRTEKIFEKAEEIYKEYSKRIPNEKLREIIRMAESEKPLSRKGQLLMIRNVEQLEVRPPIFMFSVNNPELMHFSYKRFLENKLRHHFGFFGSPIILKFRISKQPN